PSGPMLTAPGSGLLTGMVPSSKYDAAPASHVRRWINGWRLPSGIRMTLPPFAEAGWPETFGSQNDVSAPVDPETPSIAVVSQKPEPSDTQMSPSGSTMAPDGSVSPVATTV